MWLPFMTNIHTSVRYEFTKVPSTLFFVPWKNQRISLRPRDISHGPTIKLDLCICTIPTVGLYGKHWEFSFSIIFLESHHDPCEATAIDIVASNLPSAVACHLLPSPASAAVRLPSYAPPASGETFNVERWRLCSDKSRQRQRQRQRQL